MDFVWWLNLTVAIFFTVLGYYYLVHIPKKRKERSKMSEAELWQWAYKKMHNSAFVKYAIWSFVYAVCLVFTLPVFGLMFHLSFLMKLVSGRYSNYWVVFNTFTISSKTFGYYILLIGPVCLLSVVAITRFEKWQREMEIIEDAAKEKDMKK